MSRKGGYLILDLENIDLTIQSNLFSIKKVEALFNLIKNNYHKQVIISGIKINGIEKNDCVTDIFHISNSNMEAYLFSIYGINVSLLHTLTSIAVLPEYSINVVSGSLDELSGVTDNEGVIKVNYADFVYRKNLRLILAHGEELIFVPYDIITPNAISGPQVIYNNGTIKIVLDVTENDYYTIQITGGTVNGLQYAIEYIG